MPGVLRGSSGRLQDLTAPGEPLFLPLVAVGELYKGALKSNHPQRNRLKIEEFLRVAAILYLDLATAEAYARIAESLAARGTPYLWQAVRDSNLRCHCCPK